MAQFAEIAFSSTNLTGTTFTFNVYIKECGGRDWVETHTNLSYTDFPVYVNLELTLGEIECYEYKVVEQQTNLYCLGTVNLPIVSPTPTPIPPTPTSTPSETPTPTPSETPPTPTPTPCLLSCEFAQPGTPCLVDCNLESIVLDCTVEESEAPPLECVFEPCLISCVLSATSCVLECELSGSTGPTPTPSVTPTNTPTNTPTSTPESTPITTPTSTISISEISVFVEARPCSNVGVEIDGPTVPVSYSYTTVATDTKGSSNTGSLESRIGSAINVDMSAYTSNLIACGLSNVSEVELIIDGSTVRTFDSSSAPSGSYDTLSYKFTPSSPTHSITIRSSAR